MKQRRRIFRSNLFPCLISASAMLLAGCNNDAVTATSESVSSIESLQNDLASAFDDPNVKGCIAASLSLDKYINAVSDLEDSNREQYGAIAAQSGANQSVLFYGAVVQYGSELSAGASNAERSCKSAANRLNSFADGIRGFSDLADVIRHCGERASIVSTLDHAPIDVVNGWREKGPGLKNCRSEVSDIALLHGIKFVAGNTKTLSENSGAITTSSQKSTEQDNSNNIVISAPEETDRSKIDSALADSQIEDDKTCKRDRTFFESLNPSGRRQKLEGLGLSKVTFDYLDPYLRNMEKTYQEYEDRLVNAKSSKECSEIAVSGANAMNDAGMKFSNASYGAPG
ncbi:hypothetical protein C8J25_101716 [Sphingomonas faeni]|uniref:Lipoprotein n=1 Tax=Sphingomonas faeni TaxID=185950 RepID=A0A2T5UCI3_9SPHN|nr:hypothetical protein [Sphingomonas faeni]PTW49210.1 hypothetical protein C8J25_101716 [Sphingomonas faeni]